MDDLERDLAPRRRAIWVAEEQEQVGAGADVLSEGEVKVPAQAGPLVGPGLVDDAKAEAALGAQEVVPGQDGLGRVRVAQAQAAVVELEREGARDEDALRECQEVIRLTRLPPHCVADAALLVEGTLAPAELGLVGVVAELVALGLVNV
ncbi:MAG: hypothetical protein M3Y56_13085, partial [Armatimonadota bacterium]|nr:hypothetical protein [Armatimonadota bacterium]